MLMWTDREYLEREFDEIKADIAEMKSDVKDIRAAIVDNRIELAKAGTLSAAMIALVEIFKYGTRHS